MASGKDTIKNELIKMGMSSVTTYTTRPKRNGEIDGISYHFISKNDFIEKMKNGFFAETTSYNVATGDTWFYGSAVDDLTNNKVIIVNPIGLKKIIKLKHLSPVSFYITVNDCTIWNRIYKRGDNVEEVKRRLHEDLPYFDGIYNDIDFVFRNDIGMSPRSVAECILYTYKKVIGGIDLLET